MKPRKNPSFRLNASAMWCSSSGRQSAEIRWCFGVQCENGNLLTMKQREKSWFLFFFLSVPVARCQLPVWIFSCFSVAKQTNRYLSSPVLNGRQISWNINHFLGSGKCQCSIRCRHRPDKPTMQRNTLQNVFNCPMMPFLAKIYPTDKFHCSQMWLLVGVTMKQASNKTANQLETTEIPTFFKATNRPTGVHRRCQETEIQTQFFCGNTSSHSLSSTQVRFIQVNCGHRTLNSTVSNDHNRSVHIRMMTHCAVIALIFNMHAYEKYK